MAQVTTLEGLRSQLLTTIFGRRFGLDPNSYAAGVNGFRTPVNTLSSASSSAALAFGGTVSLGTATGGTTWNVAAPVPGVEMDFVQSSTAGGVIALASGGIIGATGSTYAHMTFANLGDSIRLKGLTTGLAAVVGGTQRPTSAASTSLTNTVALS